MPDSTPMAMTVDCGSLGLRRVSHGIYEVGNGRSGCRFRLSHSCNQQRWAVVELPRAKARRAASSNICTSQSVAPVFIKQMVTELEVVLAMESIPLIASGSLQSKNPE